MNEREIELNKNMREIYYLDLALQGYELHTGITLTELIETINSLNYLRTKKDELDNDKKLELTKIILKGQNNAVDIIGRDKFSFYDDGVIEYNWGKHIVDEEKIEDSMYRILRLSLAFEDYIDNTGDDISELNEAYDCLKLFREKRDNYSKENQEKMLSDLLEKFHKVLDIVGRDKFIVYDDGDINYVWDYSLTKKENTSNE